MKPRKRPRFFEVDRIILAKGSLSSTERTRLVEEVVSLYPAATVIEKLQTPHNLVEGSEPSAPLRVSRGKRTLVFGEHKSAVKKSMEAGNACPNYWHFSPYGFCFYGCKYCYLAGTRGVWHSPTVKIFVNLPEITDAIDRAARRDGRPTAFYLGKLQDGLALDPLSAYSEALVPFFADHPCARQILLTKSDDVDRLLGLNHQGHTTLSWSLNPPEIASRFEENVPTVEDRIAAMKKCAAAGYPVRAVVMPLIPAPGWEDIYPAFIREFVSEVPVERLTIGGICIYRNAKRLMEDKLGIRNELSESIDVRDETGDGRARYGHDLRVGMYRAILEAAHAARTDLQLALCLEDARVFEALGISGSIGRCNCGL